MCFQKADHEATSAEQAVDSARSHFVSNILTELHVDADTLVKNEGRLREARDVAARARKHADAAKKALSAIATMALRPGARAIQHEASAITAAKKYLSTHEEARSAKEKAAQIGKLPGPE